jgi:hypothetical protein
MTTKWLCTAALLVLLPACGSAEAEPSAPAPSTLSVTQAYEGGSLYIEGAVWFTRIERSDGSVAATARVAPGEAQTFSRTLEPGTYTLDTFQRPCEGSCSAALDPPTDHCATDLELEPGRTLGVTVHVTPGSDCEITTGIASG